MDVESAEEAESTGLGVPWRLELSETATELSRDLRNGGIFTGGSFTGGNDTAGNLSLEGLKSHSRSCLLQFIPVLLVNSFLKFEAMIRFQSRLTYWMSFIALVTH